MNILNEVTKHAGTDAEIAAAINADSIYWKEIATDKVWAWLADGGRLYILESFGDSINPQSDDAATIALKSAVKTLLKALNNTLTTLDPTPGSDQRTLINAVASALSLDISSLLSKGRPANWVDVTEQQVTDAKATNARNAEIRPWIVAADYAAQAAQFTARQANTTLADVRAAMIADFDARTA